MEVDSSLDIKTFFSSWPILEVWFKMLEDSDSKATIWSMDGWERGNFGSCYKFGLVMDIFGYSEWGKRKVDKELIHPSTL